MHTRSTVAATIAKMENMSITPQGSLVPVPHMPPIPHLFSSLYVAFVLPSVVYKWNHTVYTLFAWLALLSMFLRLICVATCISS